MQQQLRLFAPGKPLVDLLGPAFFNGLPTTPGVYIMGDGNGRPLYIGQSQNLRKRLAYYKNANPERVPRKIIRLVYQTHTVAWETCPTPASAIARETELLRLHRPKFNVANTYSPPPTSLWLLARGDDILFGRTKDADPHARTFGPFIEGTVRLHGALLRVMYLLCEAEVVLARFPALLFSNRPPAIFEFHAQAGNPSWHLLEEYLCGKTEALMAAAGERLTTIAQQHQVLGQILEQDTELLRLLSKAHFPDFTS